MQVLAWLAWKLFLRTPLQRRAMRKHQQRSGRERRLGIFRGHQKTTFRNPRWFSSKIVSLNIFLKKNQEGVSDAMEMGDDGGYCLCTPPKTNTEPENDGF